MKGYTIEAVETGRQSLQPLLLAYGFDSFRGGRQLVFANRGGSVVREIDRGRCAVVGREPVVSLTRAPVAEAADRVTLGFVRAELDYLPGAVEALAPDAAEPRTEQMSVQLVFGEGEARAVAERALSEGLIARDTLACALPLSLLAVTPGDTVSLASGGSTDLFRVDRIEEAGHRAVDGGSGGAGGLPCAGAEVAGAGRRRPSARRPRRGCSFWTCRCCGATRIRPRPMWRWRGGPGLGLSPSTRRTRTSAMRSTFRCAGRR